MKQLQIYPVTDRVAEAMLEDANAAEANTFPDPGAYAVVALTKAGNMYQGVSYKSDTYTLTMHAEATALAHATIHGEREIIAITGPNCHMCKQLIWERALLTGINIQVVIDVDGHIRLVPISEQMPYPWPDVDGNH